MRNRGLILTVLCAMQLMTILDGSVVAVALPQIQSGLGFSDAGLAWVVNGYLIPFAGLLLLSGRLGDLLGSARVFLAGLGLFTAASLVCGLAVSPAMLVGGRVAQGVGGALASAVVLGMIVRLFPEPAGQARAMGVYSFVGAGGASLGVLAGGVLTQVAGWEWAFLINVPIGVLSFVVALKWLPRDAGAGLSAGADAVGAILVTGGLSAGIYAIVGSASGNVLVPAVLAVVLLVGFFVRQALAERPLVPLRVLTRRTSGVANLSIVFVTAAGFGFQFVTALYLQRLLGLGAAETGLAFLPTPLVIGVFSLVLTPRLAGRIGPRAVLLSGLPLVGAGLLFLARVPVGGSYFADVLPAMLLAGAGMGLVLPSMVMLAMSDAQPGEEGLASGVNGTAMQAGGALGTAVLVTLAASRTDALKGAGDAAEVALAGGFRAAYLVAVGFVVASWLVAATLPRVRRSSPAPVSPKVAA